MRLEGVTPRLEEVSALLVEEVAPLEEVTVLQE